MSVNNFGNLCLVIRGKATTPFTFNNSEHLRIRYATEALNQSVGSDLVSALAENLGMRTINDWLTVYEHAVTIKHNQIEIRYWHRTLTRDSDSAPRTFWLFLWFTRYHGGHGQRIELSPFAVAALNTLLVHRQKHASAL